MDSTPGGSSINGTQHTNNPTYSFLDGIQGFAGTEGLQNGGEDYSQYFDPALFESSYPHQQPSVPHNFSQHMPRPSGSPGIPPFNPAEPQFAPGQYSTPLYDARPMPQANYDPGFYGRPSVPAVGFDGAYGYQQPINFAGQNYQAQPMNLQPRHSPTPQPTYPPQNQQSPPYVGLGSRPSHMSQVQNQEMMHYRNFQDPRAPPTHSFVDPSILTANQLMDTSSTANTFQTHDSYLDPTYFKPDSTVTPSSIQNLPHIQPAPSPVPQPAPTAPTLQPGQQGATKKAEVPIKAKSPKEPHVPKKSKAVVSKSATTAGAKSDGRFVDLDSASGSDDEVPPEGTPAFLSVAMPTDESGRYLYSAVQAVWSPRNKSVSTDKIRSGIAGFGDAVRGLRDSWKAKNDALKMAELPHASTSADVGHLKAEVARYRQVLETAMTRSLEYGHPAIVRSLGENQFTMSALYSFMLDRFNATDFDSPLVGAIMKFVLGFETLDTEMLEMTKLSKILQRFTKRAASDVKTMAQKILDNAVAASKRKATSGDSRQDKPTPPAVPGTTAEGPRKDVAAGTKRSREADAAQSAPKKLVRVAVQSSKPLALQNAERRKALEATQNAKAGDKAAPSPPSANGPSKAKVAVAAPPKSAVFSSLVSASKKPGTSLAARAAAARDKSSPSATPPTTVAALLVKKDPAKRDSPPRVAPVAKVASSFLGLLADMEKKPVQETKKETEIPNETEEEKAKRLRKESRRKLRVSWKAEGDLVEIRHFTHDPDEEIGHGDNMLRDAGDSGREGEALKLHKGLDDLEEDEEDENGFEDLEPYTPPSEVDFPGASDDPESFTPNSHKFGGQMAVDSPSRDAQDQHEQDAVMAVFTGKADRPATPKELDENDEGDFEPAEPETPFGEPSATTRRREKEYQARLSGGQPATSSMPFKADLAQLLGLPAQQQTASASPDLHSVLQMLGHSKQGSLPVASAGPSNVDLQALLQSVQQVNHQLQGQSQYPAPTQAPSSNNLAALLASMQNAAQGPSVALPLGRGGNPNPFPGSFDEPSRKHARGDSYDLDSDYARKDGHKKSKTLPDGKPRPYNYKTQVCTFWEQGKCTKGSLCTYRHGDEDV